MESQLKSLLAQLEDDQEMIAQFEQFKSDQVRAGDVNHTDGNVFYNSN